MQSPQASTTEESSNQSSGAQAPSNQTSSNWSTVATSGSKVPTIIALMTVLLLAALDQSIISTAMPRIIAELHGLEMYSWTATAYMLTSTIMVPIYGKLGDLHGRKIVLIVGVCIFLFGSTLCGLSGEFGDLPILGSGMVQLIVFRAVQGLGSGALFSGAFAVIGDLYPPRQRGKVMGLFGAIFGLASVAGPAIGGFFTDLGMTHLFGYEFAGWRWVFYVNLPFGMAALFMLIFKMPHSNTPSGGRVDYWGAAFLVATFVPLLLALTWAGRSYAWSSPVIIAMFAGAALSLGIFVLIEARFPEPIMPLSLLRNRAFAMVNLAAFVISMAFFGIIMFMPLYMQLVLGVSATKSGFSLLPLMVSMMITSIVSGRLVSRTGRYKGIMLGGCVMLVITVLLLLQIGPDTTIMQLDWRFVLAGISLGPLQSLYSLAAQNAAPLSQLGIATSSSQFFRQIGSTVGLAIFGTLLTHNLVKELPKSLPAASTMSEQKVDLGQMQARAMNPGHLREEVEQEMQRRGVTPNEQSVTAIVQRIERGIKEGFSAAIVGMFKGVLWIVGLGLVLTWLIPVLPLRDHSAAMAKRA